MRGFASPEGDASSQLLHRETVRKTKTEESAPKGTREVATMLRNTQKSLRRDTSAQGEYRVEFFEESNL